MVKEALNGVEEGIKVGGRMVNEDRFADDQGMVANTEAGLQEIVELELEFRFSSSSPS